MKEKRRIRFERKKNRKKNARRRLGEGGREGTDKNQPIERMGPNIYRSPAVDKIPYLPEKPCFLCSRPALSFSFVLSFVLLVVVGCGGRARWTYGLRVQVRRGWWIGPRTPLRAHGPLSQIEIAIFNENSFESVVRGYPIAESARLSTGGEFLASETTAAVGPRGARWGPAADKSLSGRARYSGRSMAAAMAVYLLSIHFYLSALSLLSPSATLSLS